MAVDAKIKAEIAALHAAFIQLPWYKKLFFPNSLKQVLLPLDDASDLADVALNLCKNSQALFASNFACMQHFAAGILMSAYNMLTRPGARALQCNWTNLDREMLLGKYKN